MVGLSTDLQRNTFDIGELALECQEHGYFHEWGFSSLGEYGELELGIKHRKLQYMARITKVTRDCGIKRSDYEPAKVTKLRSICSLDPDSSFFDQELKKHRPMVEYIVELVAEAPELSAQEIDDRVAYLKGQTGDNAMVKRGYSVTRSAWDNVIAVCFESVRKRLGSKGRDETGKAVEYGDGAVIECLCAEYNSDPRNFLEDEDCSKEQIEVQEESNVGTTGTTSGLDIPQESEVALRSPRKVLPGE
jgi:hypothetical protein